MYSLTLRVNYTILKIESLLYLQRKGVRMKEYLPVLKKTQLFSGVNDDEIEAMLSCLQAGLKAYKKGEYIIRQGESVTSVMILLHGKCNIQHDDYWGNRSIVNVIMPGEMFGESYIAPDSSPMMNDVFSVEDIKVLLIDPQRIITTCSSACKFHSKIVQNLFFAISEKNRKLVQKMGYMSKRTTKEKLISFLSDEAARQKSSMITIPFNRQQLADFLSVDRSAMSNELCKMRDEGLIEFEKNAFKLIEI